MYTIITKALRSEAYLEGMKTIHNHLHSFRCRMSEAYLEGMKTLHFRGTYRMLGMGPKPTSKE